MAEAGKFLLELIGWAALAALVLAGIAAFGGLAAAFGGLAVTLWLDVLERLDQMGLLERILKAIRRRRGS